MNNNTIEPSKCKDQTRRVREAKRKKGRSIGQFVRETGRIRDVKTSFLWVGKGDLKIDTKALIMTAQDQSVLIMSRTILINEGIHQSVNGECMKLAQKEHKRLYNTTLIIRLKICKKFD